MFHASYSWSGPQLPKGCGCIGFLSPMHKKIPDSYLKREGDNPGNSGLSSVLIPFHPFTFTLLSYSRCWRLSGSLYCRTLHTAAGRRRRRRWRAWAAQRYILHTGRSIHYCGVSPSLTLNRVHTYTQSPRS